MTFVHAIDGSGRREDASIPSDRVAAGHPRTIATTDYQCGEKIYAGEWSATVGAWSVKYDEWEFCHILAGLSVVTEDDGEARIVKPGDSFVLRPGFSDTWEVIQTTRKEYVIRL